jgi:hypothetical protein
MFKENYQSFLNHKYAEWVLFFIFYALVVWPILSVDYFVTHDGAAHLYNADILIDLLFKHNYYYQFYELNPEPEPNLMGHLLLVFLRLFFSPLLTEKLIALISILLFALSVRYFIKALNIGFNWFYFAVFLFVYNNLFVLGFYNFILSLSVFFWVCGWFLKNKNNPTKQNVVIMSFLSLILYFSHLFSFALYLVFISIFTLSDFIKLKTIRNIAQRIEFIFLSNLLPILFLLNYFLKKKSGEKIYWTLHEKIDYLLKIKPIVNFDPAVMDRYFIILKWIFIITSFIALIYHSLHKRTLHQIIPFIIFILITAFLYFILPNTSSGGGYISDRFALYLYLFIIVFIASAPIQLSSTLINSTFLIIIIPLTARLTLKATEIYQFMNNEITNLMKCQSSIKNGAVVLPIVFQKHWLYGHVSNYLSINKPLVLLENYEASQGYFPVLWKSETLPIINLPIIFNTPTYLDFSGYYQRSGLKVNYVLLWDNIKDYSSPQQQQLLNDLNENYQLIYQDISQNIQLFELK